MRLITKDSYEGLSLEGASFIARAIEEKPDSSVVVATGDTPMGTYRELVKMQRRGEVDPSRLRVFQLDEYLGLGLNDPRALFGWTVHSFIEPLGVPLERVVRLEANAPDPDAACRAYERAVRDVGGFDLAILGLGPNGHLGFNEPPSDASSPTRVVSLTEESIESNARYWGPSEHVPRRAVTAGMDLLLASREILLLVSGEHKRDILERALNGPITPEIPASYLQTAHNVTVLTDKSALGSRSAASSSGDSASKDG